MSIGSKRDVVIENIKTALIEENYYKKVEVDDPELTIEQRREITSKFLSKRKTLPYQLKTFMARSLANIGSILINKDTKIIGEVDSDLLKNVLRCLSIHA